MSLNYNLQYDEKFVKQLKKLDSSIRKKLLHWIEERLVHCTNPRLWGTPLQGTEEEIWRYRIGDYRLLCQIQDQNLVILVLEFGHRKEIYRH